MKVKTTQIRLLSEITNIPNLDLLCDSQDLEAIFDYLGLDEASGYREAGFALVEVGDGDYEQIWLCMEHSVPWLTCTMEKLEWSIT